jgi:hypothetical protein
MFDSGSLTGADGVRVIEREYDEHIGLMVEKGWSDGGAA